MALTPQQQEARLVALGDERHALMNYLDVKVRAADWHAVADAAMDLREVEAQIRLLERIADDRKGLTSV